MEPIEITGDEVVNVASASILSGPDDAIWDTIFDWVEDAIEFIVEPICDWIDSAVEWVADKLEVFINWVVGGVSTVVNWIFDTASNIWTWVVDIYHDVRDWAMNAWDTIYLATRTATTRIWDWISSVGDVVMDWVTDTAINLWDWITESISNLWTNISNWFTNLWDNISTAFYNFGQGVWEWIQSIPEAIGDFFSDLWENIATAFENIKTWFTETLVDTMQGWWDWFIGKLFDFGSWIGGLFEAAWNWINRDVPGSSPWWEGVLETVLGKWIEILMWVPSKVTPVVVDVFSTVVIEALRPIGEVFNNVAEVFMDAIDGFVAALGPTNPDVAGTAARSLASVGMTAIAGLAGMTLASSWLKPLGGAGMGQIAAMIYDMTNFKVITGAAITALTIAAIRTPMTYHYNEVFRPNLISERDFMELMSRRAFTEPETLQNPDLVTAVRGLPAGGGQGYEMQYIGYRGYPDQYYGIFKELANTPLRYFPLAGIARTGFFDETWFKEALARSGYSKTAKDALLVMYQKMRDEVLQGSMSGAAVTRFKEGFDTEEQFHGNMTLLGYSDDQFAKYLVAAEMDYATDYARDLLTAYRDTLRQGKIDIDTYRQRLLGLGIVPERVEGYVLREVARLKPEEALTPIGPPGEVYLTDTGKVQVDTIRRRRRKLLISRGDEVVALVALGTAQKYAEAIADNDDVRLAEKGEEE